MPEHTKFITPTAVRRIAKQAGVKRMSMGERDMKQFSYGQDTKKVKGADGKPKNVRVKTIDEGLYAYLMQKLGARLERVVEDAVLCARAADCKTVLCRHAKVAIDRLSTTPQFFGDCPVV